MKIFFLFKSTMSTGLNSMAMVIFKDIIQSYLIRKPTSLRTADRIMNSAIFIISSICLALTLFAEKSKGGILQFIWSSLAVTSGAKLGIFTLGIFFPCLV